MFLIMSVIFPKSLGKPALEALLGALIFFYSVLVFFSVALESLSKLS